VNSSIPLGFTFCSFLK